MLAEVMASMMVVMTDMMSAVAMVGLMVGL